MPLGNPNFIDLDPRIVAEDRERFRQAKILAAQETVGKVALEQGDLIVPIQAEDPDAEGNYHSVSPAFLVGSSRPLEFQPY